jgi:hypothetical protein
MNKWQTGIVHMYSKLVLFYVHSILTIQSGAMARLEQGRTRGKAPTTIKSLIEELDDDNEDMDPQERKKSQERDSKFVRDTIIQRASKSPHFSVLLTTNSGFSECWIGHDGCKWTTDAFLAKACK